MGEEYLNEMPFIMDTEQDEHDRAGLEIANLGPSKYSCLDLVPLVSVWIQRKVWRWKSCWVTSTSIAKVDQALYSQSPTLANWNESIVAYSALKS